MTLAGAPSSTVLCLAGAIDGARQAGDVCLPLPFTYSYPRPAVTCDSVVFTMRADDLAVLLVQRKWEPYRGRWALPGGFVNHDEPLERAALRELAEETGLGNVKLEEIGAFGDPGRDPRGHTISIAWMTFLVAEAAVTAGDDASAAAWHDLRSLALALDEPPQRARGLSRLSEPASTRPVHPTRGGRAPALVRLAFDHAKIVARAYQRLCQHLYAPLRDRGLDVLPTRFTLAELQKFYEIVLGRSLPQRGFRNRLLSHALVVPASAKPTRRPSEQLYRWNHR